MGFNGSIVKRYHRIAEDPKLKAADPEQWHHYSELDTVIDALKELLWMISDARDRDDPLNRDRAEVAYKTLYRLAEHHKQGRQGRPDYPEFSWGVVEMLVQRKEPLFSTAPGGGLGPNSPAMIRAPAAHQEA